VPGHRAVAGVTRVRGEHAEASRDQPRHRVVVREVDARMDHDDADPRPWMLRIGPVQRAKLPHVVRAENERLG
jgi:hypothetical protein